MHPALDEMAAAIKEWDSDAKLHALTAIHVAHAGDIDGAKRMAGELLSPARASFVQRGIELAFQKPAVEQPRSSTYADGTPVLEGEMPEVTYAEALRAVSIGKAELMVDQGLAVAFMPILNLSTWSISKPLFGLMLAIAAIPAWLLLSPWLAPVCIIAGILLYRSSRHDIVRATARAALGDADTFHQLHQKRVVWLRRSSSGL